MFGLFKRKKGVTWEVELFKKVFISLSKELQGTFLLQLGDGLLNNIDVTNDPINYVGFTYDPSISDRYIDEKGRTFYYSIKVFDKKSSSYIDFNIHITHGLICGYSTPTHKDFDLDDENIEVSGLSIVFEDEEGLGFVRNILDAKELSLINLSEVYEVVLDGELYYHLKDIGDGDFIGINKEKSIFRITHDPFEVVSLNDSLWEVLKW